MQIGKKIQMGCNIRFRHLFVGGRLQTPHFRYAEFYQMCNVSVDTTVAIIVFIAFDSGTDFLRTVKWLR